MDNKSEPKQSDKGSISLENRRKMSLTGVLEVISFDDEKIIFNTILGKLTVKGQGLKMNKLDVKNSDVMIEGYISSIVYSGKVKNKSKKNIIRRLLGKR